MKVCVVCKVPQDVEAFARNVRKPDGRQSYCRACQKPRQAAWYARNKQKHIGNVKVRTVQTRKDRAAKLVDYLLAHPCVDCGEADPLVLDFDHVRGSKRANITELVAAGFAWKTIEDEIAKCQVRCANCHRRKTARERNTERHLLCEEIKRRRAET